MKLIKGLLGLVIIGGGLVAGSMFYTKQASGEFAQILDRINPLVKTGHVYVKTTKPIEVNGYGTAAYEQTAVDETGHTRPIAFNGLTELKRDRYLKLTNKGAFVETYEEVTAEELPEKVLKELG